MKRLIVSLFMLFVIHILLVSPSVVFAQPAGQAGGGLRAVTPVGESACAKVDSEEAGTCRDCFSGGGAYTAIGCLGGESPSDFVSSIIRIGTGLGGGIAFLLILFSGFQTITSTGNPEKLHAAKELMSAAISGLLLIIFSIFMLRVIGVDILGGITGFGG